MCLRIQFCRLHLGQCTRSLALSCKNRSLKQTSRADDRNRSYQKAKPPLISRCAFLTKMSLAQPVPPSVSNELVVWHRSRQTFVAKPNRMEPKAYHSQAFPANIGRKDSVIMSFVATKSAFCSANAVVAQSSRRLEVLLTSPSNPQDLPRVRRACRKPNVTTGNMRYH